MRFFRRDVQRLGQILHIALLQQLKVIVHDQRGHFHRAAALFEFRLGLHLEAAVRIFPSVLIVLRIDLAQFRLLGRNLDQKALAQIRAKRRRPDPGAAPGRCPA